MAILKTLGLNSLFGKFKKFLNKNTHIVCLIVLIIIGGYLVNFYMRSREGYEGQKELLLLHMEGCPHCVKLMPHWNAASKDNKTSIKMRVLERNEPGAKKIIQKNKVKGFPTILLRGGDKTIDTYNGPRTKQGLVSYCQKNA